MEPSKGAAKIWGIVGGIVVIIAGVLGYTNFGKTTASDSTDQAGSTTTDSTTDTTNTPVTTGTQGTGSVQTSKYKDGTYSAEGTYVSPGGGDKVGVTLTIKNDIVVASTFKPEANDPTSAEFQQQFAAGYKVYVVGKNIDQINIGKVSGSSLTGRGFNDAVAKIKAEAQA